MITSGEAKKAYITEAVEHVMLRQGTIGVRVTIMLPHDPDGQNGGVRQQLPDMVTIHNPKDYDAGFEGGDFQANQQQDQAAMGMQQQDAYGQQQQDPQYQQQQQAPQYGQTPGGPPQQFGGPQYGAPAQQYGAQQNYGQTQI